LAVPLNTSRGLYQLSSAAPPTSENGAVLLTLAIERADGIEKVVFRCRVAEGLLQSSRVASRAVELGGPEIEGLLKLLSPWLEREFEQVREAALKSIRTERKPFELRFDESARGPF
jgi:hypothetical protein